MTGIFNFIKGILFLLLGVAVVFVPYSKFKRLPDGFHKRLWIPCRLRHI